MLEVPPIINSVTSRIHTLLSEFTHTASNEMHKKFNYRDDIKVKEDIPHFTEKFTDSLNKEFGLNLSKGDMEGFGDLGELVEGVNARLL